MKKSEPIPTTADEAAAIERRAAGKKGAPLSPKYGGPCVSRQDIKEDRPPIDPVAEYYKSEHVSKPGK